MIGANDPCFCGSGKKYKKCCGVKERPAPRGQPARASRSSRAPTTVNRQPATTPSPPHLPPGTDKARGELETLLGLLDREAGLLQHHPYLFSSHLHNRLRMEGGQRSLLINARRALATRPWAELSNRVLGLNAQATVRVLMDYAGALAFSPDGTLLATASNDFVVRLWDLTTGRCVEEILCDLTATASLAWSPNGRWLAASSEQGGVWICEVASRRSQRYPDRGTTIAWAPDGAKMASAATATEIWDPDSGQVLKSFAGGAVLASALAWSPDGEWLASGDSWGTVRIWSPALGQASEVVIQLGPPSLRRPRAHAIAALAWAPEGTVLAAAAQDGTLTFFEPFPWQQTSVVKLSDFVLRAIAWSPDGRELAVARDVVLDIVDIRSSRQRGSLEYMSDWARVSIRGPSGTSAPAATIVGSFAGHTAPIEAVAWSPGGGMVASAARDGTIRLWSVERMQAASPASATPDRRSPARRPSAAPNTDAERTLATDSGLEHPSIREILESDPETIARYFAIPEIGGSSIVALSPDGRRVATAEGVKDVLTSSVIVGLKSGARLTALSWSLDGTRLAIGREDGEVLIGSAGPDGLTNLIREGWTEAKAREYAKWKLERSPGFIDLTPSIGGYQLRINDPDYSPVDALAWSPDGRLLAVAGFTLGLELHNLETGETARLEVGPGFQAMHYLAWSPDGSLLASAEGARNAIMDRPFLVRLWNLQTGEARTVFEGNARWSALAWAPDGSLLGFADSDGWWRRRGRGAQGRPTPTRSTERREVAMSSNEHSDPRQFRQVLEAFQRAHSELATRWSSGFGRTNLRSGTSICSPRGELCRTQVPWKTAATKGHVKFQLSLAIR